MDVKGKKVLVVGLEKTGEAVCHFLLSKGSLVKVSEKKTKEELGEKIRFWQDQGVTIESGGHALQSFLDSDLIIPSPGVSMIPPLEKARKQGINVISEIELAFSFLKGKIVGVTGSNGKSTVCTLIHKILKEGGVNSHLAGNIGTPLISFVSTSKEEDIHVTELSSFQLAYVKRFKPSTSIFLNITPDHLDWHHNFENYFSAKKNILSLLGQNEIAILNQDDPLVWGLKDTGPFQLYSFSRKQEISRGCFMRGDQIILSLDKEEQLLSIPEIPLLGIHNLENIMAAALASRLYGVSPQKIKSGILSFKGLEHRLEKVTTIAGIEFYNDSKATNIDAAQKSIESFQPKLILIMGGRDKGGDFSPLKAPIAERAKKVILLGESQEKLKKALQDVVPIAVVSTMGDAVRLGFRSAEPGNVVLLAPACTSFDMFTNFEHRGRVFKQEVFSLAETLSSGKR